MLQVSIEIGRSTGYDCSLLSVPFGTAVGAGRMAICIGETLGLPAMSSGEIIKRAKEAIGMAAAQYRVTQGPLRVEYDDPRVSSSAVVTPDAVAMTSDATIGVIINGEDLEGRTGLLENGLSQAHEVLRESINAHQTSIVA